MQHCLYSLQMFSFCQTLNQFRSEYLREFARICGNLQGPAWICRNLQESVGICVNLRESAGVCVNLCESAGICGNLRESAGICGEICGNLQESVKICENLWESVLKNFFSPFSVYDKSYFIPWVQPKSNLALALCNPLLRLQRFWVEKILCSKFHHDNL